MGLDPAGITLARAKGCAKCNGSGYKGRLGLHELLECGDEMKVLIKNKAQVAQLRSQSIADGMTTLKQAGILKCLQGLTAIHEVRRVCIK
jgi:type II secretory ATPase GspE/PulE/Tfp pilus assembly ATPase PilB-like protein